MTPERWATVKAILARALEEDKNRRRALVDEACGSDEALRKEVHSLLAHEERENSFLGRPLLDSALNLWKYALSSAARPATAAALECDASRAQSPRLPQSPGRPAFFWFASTLFIVFVMLYAHAARTIYTHGNTTKEFGWGTTRRGGGWIVTGVNPAGPAANLVQNGDELVAFNGDPRARVVGAGIYKRFSMPHAPYRLRIRRDALSEHEYHLQVAAAQRPAGAIVSAVFVALSMSFCLIALALGFLRPRDRLAQLGCLAGALAALTLLGIALMSYRGMDGGVTSMLNDAVWLLDPLYLALGYHFFFRLGFPTGRPFVWFGLSALLYGICIFHTGVTVILGVATFGGQEMLVALAYAYPILIDLNLFLLHSAWTVGLTIVAYSSMSAVVVRGYRQSSNRDQRRRIAWVVFGSLIGLVPLALFSIVDLVLRLSGQKNAIQSAWWIAVEHLAYIFLVAVPLTLAYAVVKHRLLDIRLVVRRTLQYLLATRILQAVLLLPILALLWPVVTNPDRSVVQSFRTGSLYSTVFLLVALVLSLKYRQQLRGWLDRRFFRDAHRQESLLGNLAREIKNLHTVDEVAAKVGKEVSNALHPSFVTVYHRLHRGGPLVLSHSSGEASHEVQDLADARVAELAAMEITTPQEVTLPSVMRSEDTDSALLVPINHSSGWLMGVLLLGGRKSEEPYGPAERLLLQSVTAQMAVAQENVWLRERVGEEQRLRTDVLGHLSPLTYNLLMECPACGLCFDSGAAQCREDSAELTHCLPVERVVGDRYRLDRRLGRGGMGAVYEAFDLHLSRKVAVKFMLGKLFGNQSVLRRFEREAHAVARLNHPNIVALYDFGRIGDGAYLIMERVPGTTWRAELDRRGLLSFGVLTQWLEQLLAGLAVAHAAGVIHRDLKPENVLVTPGPDGSAWIKIVDFGLAKLEALDGHPVKTITKDGSVMGTLGYMPPEQLLGHKCDERSDVFSVGAMAVEAITGVPPFAGASGPEILVAIERQELRLAANSPVTAHLAEALTMCLRYEASKRYQSVTEMQRHLLKSLRACVPLDSSESFAPLLTNKS
jgi:hypothetical protein